MPKKLTQAEFVAKAVAVHGDKYDYSQAVYVGVDSKVVIICPEHGTFKQTPYHHTTSGNGCPKCGDARAASIRTHTTADFITAAQAVHGVGAYDYSQTVYRSAKEKVIVGCPAHGFFRQEASSHKQGVGCPTCWRLTVGAGRRTPVAEFISRAHITHGNKYDYSRVIYKSRHTHVEIICPRHGAFEQSPSQHAHQGNGCPTCGRERTAAAKALNWAEQAAGRLAALYFLRFAGMDEVFYKVGVTYQGIGERYRKLDKFGYTYEILAQHISPDAARIYEWEQSIIETFAHLRYHPKLNFGGASECFSSADEILAIFPL